MTWIKICGTTNLEDALVAVDAGADAVGFVFYEKSPRCVSVETARKIVAKLPENVEKIGVFVDPDTDPTDVLFATGLSGIQLYFSRHGMGGGRASQGRAIGRDCMPARFRNVMAFPISLFPDDVSQIQGFVSSLAMSRANAPKDVVIPEGTLDTLLFDSGNSRQPGGTGASFDWFRVEPIADMMRSNGLKMVVAGGLKPENVAEAIKVLHPWGVDVVSGVETSPGKKDPEKVRAFVRAVREMDRKVG
jgi:phosphoribosylanthranilate isomerase